MISTGKIDESLDERYAIHAKTQISFFWFELVCIEATGKSTFAYFSVANKDDFEVRIWVFHIYELDMYKSLRCLHHKAKTGHLQPLSAPQKRLLAWVEAKGVQWPKALYPVQFPPGYLGVQAKQAIGPNETIISVPRRLVITANRVEKSELSAIFTSAPSLFKATKHSYTDDFKLILFLLSEAAKGRDSDWYFYLQTLPSSPYHISYWPPASLSHLQDESLINQAAGQLRLLKSQWKLIKEAALQHPALFTEEKITWEKFKWAEGVVSSRAFGDGRMSHCLCPIAELVNHANSATGYLCESKGNARSGKPYIEDDDDLPKALYFPSYVHYAHLINSLHSLSPEQSSDLFVTTNELDFKPEKKGKPLKTDREEDRDCLRIVSGPQETYEAGAEICLNYGPLSNRAALLRYGFAMADDDLAYCLVTVDLKEYLTREQYEKIAKKLIRTEWTFKLRKGQVCTQLITVFRALLWRPNVHTIESIFSATDDTLELAARQAATRLLERTLHDFPTSISEDQERLAYNCPLHEHFSILYRLQRKQVLSLHISLLCSPSSTSIG